MKRMLTLMFARLVTAIMVFTVITYTSCTVDKCKQINCMNGGTCTDGNCSCPSGFTGALCDTAVAIIPDTTAIAYKNNTFTPITITINGTTQTIPSGGQAVYTGAHGSPASGFAYTFGTNTSGDTVGVNYTWSSLNISFPAADTLVLPLSISQGFFYVKVINKSAQTLAKCYANYGLPGQTLDMINIPNDSLSHGLGYFQAFDNSNVRLESSNHYWMNDTLHLTGTMNQSVTVTVK